MSGGPVVECLRAQAFTIPTDAPEADGTLSWDKTTLVLVEVESGGQTALGYSYTDASIVPLIVHKLAPIILGSDAMDPSCMWRKMQVAVRNLGRSGLAATAISAIDIALWDLKARMLSLPLASLLGRFRETVPIYGSGGFTSYDDHTLAHQLAGWVENDGCRWVKMKVGSNPDRDPERVAAAKAAIGRAGLFVDANGAYTRNQALQLAEEFVAQAGISWFEEPVSSDDLVGLRFLRDRSPARLEIAAGEYGYELDYFRRMLDAGAVDVQQADATRCGGVTGFMQAATLCEAAHIDLSAHCAPAIHLHLGCAAPRFRHLEWFHDHVRIEHLLFDGAPIPRAGSIEPDLSRPGLGLVFKHSDAVQFAVTGQEVS